MMKKAPVVAVLFLVQPWILPGSALGLGHLGHRLGPLTRERPLSDTIKCIFEILFMIGDTSFIFVSLIL